MESKLQCSNYNVLSADTALFKIFERISCGKEDSISFFFFLVVAKKNSFKRALELKVRITKIVLPGVPSQRPGNCLPCYSNIPCF